MKLRVARHTTNLQPLIDFYTSILGLTVIGDFKDHAGYDGVFLGESNIGWHLEFTTSTEVPDHIADEDDLLVFYVDVQKHDTIIQRAIAKNIEKVAPKNPYWIENGTTLIDPDGYRIVVAIDK